MGINWKSGLIYWSDHTTADAKRYSLAHLHPFSRIIELPARDDHLPRSVRLHVSFSLHTFTRAWNPLDAPGDAYGDNREVRTFCMERYERSFGLPAIFRTIESRRCEFTHGLHSRTNYVVLETSGDERYAAFFDLVRAEKTDAVHLLVQSAYVLGGGQAAPGKGRIHFHALLGHALRGTRPRRPPRRQELKPQKSETPHEAGFHPSPDPLTCHRGGTSCEAGVHRNRLLCT